MVTDDYIINIVGHIKRPVKDLKNWNEYKGCVKPDGTYIPASHPYWAVNYMIANIKKHEMHSKQFEECKQNPDLIKIYYNNTTSIEQVEERVNEYKETIDILKYLNII